DQIRSGGECPRGTAPYCRDAVQRPPADQRADEPAPRPAQFLSSAGRKIHYIIQNPAGADVEAAESPLAPEIVGLCPPPPVAPPPTPAMSSASRRSSCS